MKVTLISSDDGDWEGIYVDGVLKHEGHNLEPSDILQALGVEFKREIVRMDAYEFKVLPFYEGDLSCAY